MTRPPLDPADLSALRACSPTCGKSPKCRTSSSGSPRRRDLPRCAVPVCARQGDCNGGPGADRGAVAGRGQMRALIKERNGAGGYTYHSAVLWPDGSCEDPSRILGMGSPALRIRRSARTSSGTRTTWRSALRSARAPGYRLKYWAADEFARPPAGRRVQGGGPNWICSGGCGGRWQRRNSGGEPGSGRGCGGPREAGDAAGGGLACQIVVQCWRHGPEISTAAARRRRSPHPHLLAVGSIGHQPPSLYRPRPAI